MNPAYNYGHWSKGHLNSIEIKKGVCSCHITKPAYDIDLQQLNWWHERVVRKQITFELASEVQMYSKERN